MFEVGNVELRHLHIFVDYPTIFYPLYTLMNTNPNLHYRQEMVSQLSSETIICKAIGYPFLFIEMTNTPRKDNNKTSVVVREFNTPRTHTS